MALLPGYGGTGEELKCFDIYFKVFNQSSLSKCVKIENGWMRHSKNLVSWLAGK